jgi:hypothetical protein
VNRGPLPAADQWYRLWQYLAEGEALEGNWPDAVDDMNRGLYQVPADARIKAAFFAKRGAYLQRNLSLQAALHDWDAALELVPDERTAATCAARLLVMGPPELRNPPRALSLATLLAVQEDTRLYGQVLQAMARVRLEQSDTADRELLDAVASAETAGLELEWRIAAGYFLSLAQLQEGEIDRAAESFATTARLQDEHRDSLFLDQQQELDRLRSEYVIGSRQCR